jgi:hypothetical protein
LTHEESRNVKRQVNDVDPTKLRTIAAARAKLHASSFCDALALEADLSGGRVTHKLRTLGIVPKDDHTRDESEHSKAKSEKRKACDGTVDAQFDHEFDLFGDAEIGEKVPPVPPAAPPPAEAIVRVEQRSLKEDEITELRALLDRQSRDIFALLRALPDFLVATQCEALRELTDAEVADASEEFPRLNVAAVATRVANCVHARQPKKQVVEASVCVGGIEFLERCVQGAVRAVAAMASASATSAQPSGSAAAPASPVAPTVVVSRSSADDDDDADDGGVGKQKLRRGRK